MSIIKSENGINLSNWTTILGDGNYAAPGAPPVNNNDVSIKNKIDSSVLKANILNRRIMAHNLTYHKITDPDAMTSLHEAEYQFKLPYVISTTNSDFNGQTIEGGLFVWDGPETKLDYGIAFQWVINPWDPNYKSVRYWDGSNWQILGSLEPDTDYHTISFSLDITNETAYITLDDFTYTKNIFSVTPKIGWGNTVDARFQAETISIYPPTTGTIPSQKVNFKNWSWEWSTFV